MSNFKVTSTLSLIFTIWQKVPVTCILIGLYLAFALYIMIQTPVSMPLFANFDYFWPYYKITAILLTYILVGTGIAGIILDSLIHLMRYGFRKKS